MFFSTKKDLQFDTYDEIKEMVQTLLLQECPEHRSQYHILYTANIKLAHLQAAKEHFRALIDLSTPIGTYAQQAYDSAYTQYNELHLIIRGYMYLCDEAERARYNHNLLFSKEKITQCYTLFKERKNFEDVVPIEHPFWSALKQELIPMLSLICT